MTNNTSKTQVPLDGIVVPHDLFNRLYMYLEADADSVSTDFIKELSKLKDTNLSAITSAPMSELT